MNVEAEIGYRQVGWTVGRCKFCGQHEPVRVEEILLVPTMYGARLGGAPTGQFSARCDLCQRTCDAVISDTYLPLEEWCPTVGINTLVSRISPYIRVSHDPSSKQRLQSLLKSAKDSAGVHQANVMRGIAFGGVVGASAGIVVSVMAYHSQLFEFDAIQMAMACTVPGIILGTIGGAVIDIRSQRRKRIYQRLWESWERCRYDTQRLVEVSDQFDATVRRVARRIADQVGSGDNG